MKRVSPKARLLGFGVCAGLLVGVLVVFMLIGSSGTPKARAVLPVPTKTPDGPILKVVATVTASRLRIDFRQFVGDGGSKVAG